MKGSHGMGSEDRVLPVADQLAAVTEAGGDGVLVLGRTIRLPVTNTDKVFFPGETAVTKGDLFRYYAEMADVVLPAMRNRPLVLKRYPNGIGGRPSFSTPLPNRFPGECGSARS